MKPNVPFFPALALCASLAGCTSTETGNPATPDQPIDPFASQAVGITIGLRSASPQSTPTVTGASTTITGMWLQVSELEMLTCAGGAESSEGLATPSSYSDQQTVTVGVPPEDICGIVVRTQPLSASSDPTLPQEGLGQGAVVQATDVQGNVLTAVLPDRIFSLLTPLAGSVRLDEAGDLSLVIEDTHLAEAFEGQDSGTNNGFYDSTTAPAVIALLEAQLQSAFSLVETEGTSTKPLATSATPVGMSADILCTSDCSLVDRSECLSESCEQDSCLMNTTGECGPLFTEMLACRAVLTPSDIICGPDESYSTGDSCDQEEASWSDCMRSL